MKLPSLLLSAALCACAQTAVETAAVTTASLDRTLKLPAELLPYQRVALTARVTGLVETMDVDRGSRVQAGQAIARLSAPEMKPRIAEAQSRVQTIQAQQAEAQARTLAAEAVLERLKAASATPGAVAALDVVQAEKALEAARAVEKALAASAQAAQSSVAELRELEKYLEITAPFEGVVTSRYAHPGTLAGPQHPALVDLEQTSRLRLVVAVPESEAAVIPRGAKVAFTVPSHPGRTFSATVARSAASLDPKTRTLPVECDAPNSDLALSPGLYAEAQWPARRPRPSLFLPATAVVTTTERTFVIRVRGGKAEWVTVSRGTKQGDLQEVLGPLAPGDLVVKRATDELRDGAPVRTK